MKRYTHSLAVDAGLLALRLTTGGLLAGHGAQKLFGSFDGSGLEGTAGWLESLGLRPGRPWAILAGSSELGGGLLMALGLLHPIGPIAAFGPLLMAWTRVHADKPIWASSGGAELVLSYLSVASAQIFAGPGRISLDNLLDIDTPPALVALTAVGVATGVAAGVAAGMLLHPASEMEQEQPIVQEGADNRGATETPTTAENAFTDALVEDEDRQTEHSGTVTYGGIGRDITPEMRELAAEVGGDPPGNYGLERRDEPDEDEPSTT